VRFSRSSRGPDRFAGQRDFDQFDRHATVFRRGHANPAMGSYWPSRLCASSEG
jgi:hypothetical protein